MHHFIPIAALLAAPFIQAPDTARGLVTATDAAAPGYTLFAPLQSTSTYLVDNAGEVVHEWKSERRVGQSVYLLPSGNLLRGEREDNSVFHGGGEGGRVTEYAPDGTVVWEYVCSDAEKRHHHDIEPLPNGNVLVIAWELKSEAEALAAGRDPQMLHADSLWPDMILEVAPSRPLGGEVVWEWHAWDHLVQDVDRTKANFGAVAAHPERIDVNASDLEPEPTADELAELEKLAALGYVDMPDTGRGGPPGRGADWLHTNAVAYSPELDIIALSIRELSEIWFIDHSTTTAEARGSEGGRFGRGGDLLFRYGNPRWSDAVGKRTLYGQHDVQFVPAGFPGAGNVLVFNNGERRVREFSTVDELAIPFADLLKEEARTSDAPFGGLTATLVATFDSPDFSGHISGAQRLPNGNTLVVPGETGRILELTPDGTVAWEYLNPFGGSEGAGRGPGGQMGRPSGDRGGPPSGRMGRGPGGGGPGSAMAIFRATRLTPDAPGIRALLTPHSEKKKAE